MRSSELGIRDGSAVPFRVPNYAFRIEGIMPPPNMPTPGMPPKLVLPGVKHVLAVASGKGGVGKSTVSANLALALQMAGQRVGLMDADIFGPSVPMMMGLGVMDPQKTAFPVEKYGLKLMSMGFLPD